MFFSIAPQTMFEIYAAALFAYLSIQFLVSIICFRTLNRRSKRYSSLIRRDNTQKENLGKAFIVLCLRGAESSLKPCLESLLNQDYPDFKISVVVDSKDDPAWRIVQAIAQEKRVRNLSINSLNSVSGRCSLKCESLLQAVVEIDESYDFLVSVDADSVVHSTWLRELIEPMIVDPTIAATTGYRWYLPSKFYWGSVARYIWNISAFSHMLLNSVPWGGSLAVRTSILEKTDYIERMARVISDDVLLGAVLQKSRLRLEFVPSVLILNREDCSLWDFWRWSRRQMLWARLYAPGWPRTLAQTLLLSTILPLSALPLSFYSFLEGQASRAFAFSGLFLIYVTAVLVLLALWETRFRWWTRRHYSLSQSIFSLKQIPRLFIAFPLTILCSASTLLSCIFVKKATWRGLTYEIFGPNNIRLVNYQPYRAKAGKGVSLL